MYYFRLQRGQPLQVPRAREDIPGGSGDTRPGALCHHPLAAQAGRIYRSSVRERVRPAVQFRRGVLHAAAVRPLLLGAVRDAQEEKGVPEHGPALLHDHSHRLLGVQRRHHSLVRQDADQRIPARQRLHPREISVARAVRQHPSGLRSVLRRALRSRELDLLGAARRKIQEGRGPHRREIPAGGQDALPEDVGHERLRPV